MKKGYKITIIIILILFLIGVLLFLIMPLAKSNAELALKIAENTKNKNDFENNIKSLLEIKSRYFILNAKLDKYNTQLPLSGNIPILTDQIYEVEKYSGIKISTINFKDLPPIADVNTQKQNPIGNITVDLNVTGSYYQILTFLNTLEIMPRFVKIEKISINANQAGSDNAAGNTLNQIILSATISFNTYYDKTDYEKN
ncbi:MAG: type 4a pilus biogenesis protein PilO [Candidatus Humimicrobiaceae bacterium]